MAAWKWRQLFFLLLLPFQRRRLFISVPIMLGFVLAAIILITSRSQLPAIYVRRLQHIFMNKHLDDPRQTETILPQTKSTTKSKNNPFFTPHFPHSLVIGACKAGTRAILEFLNMHPHIVRPMFEVHFFDLMVNYKKGYRWYLRQMPNSLPSQITIEKTAMYYAIPEVPKRVHQMNSSIKLLLVVRNPMSRAVSDYLHMNIAYNTHKMKYQTFEEMAINPKTGKLNLDFYAIKRSRYHQYLLSWLKYFPLSQIHIIDGDKLRTHPWEIMSGIESFLGLKRFFEKSHFYLNPDRGFYCIQLGGIRCLPKSKGREHPKIEGNVWEKMETFFRKENEKFYNLSGQTFSW